jgi:hypothetical protein
MRFEVLKVVKISNIYFRIVTPSPALKMEANFSSETLVSTDKSTRRY